jgi:parallel beta-helix repeat protein
MNFNYQHINVLQPQINPISSLVNHSKILISSTSELSNFPGNGTIDSPYIISNFFIDANGVGSPIHFMSINLYVIIENCTLINAENYHAESNIRLNGCENIVIRNNILSNSNDTGLHFDHCNNILVQNNTISNNKGLGIHLYECSNLSIRNNLIQYNGAGGIGTSQNSQQISLIQNRIQNNINSAVSLRNSNSISLLMNYLKNSSGPNIDIYQSTNITLDNGTHGNYWGDYKTRYPTAKNNGEIWDTPYQIGEFSDHYPLVDINVNYQTSSQTNSEENVFQNPFISIAGFDPNLFCVISGIFCLFLSFRIKKGKVK